jgi:hypothetical protein
MPTPSKIPYRNPYHSALPDPIEAKAEARPSAAQIARYGLLESPSQNIAELKAPKPSKNPQRDFREGWSKNGSNFMKGFNVASSVGGTKNFWSYGKQLLGIGRNILLSPVKAAKFVFFDFPKSILALGGQITKAITGFIVKAGFALYGLSKPIVGGLAGVAAYSALLSTLPALGASLPLALGGAIGGGLVAASLGFAWPKTIGSGVMVALTVGTPIYVVSSLIAGPVTGGIGSLLTIGAVGLLSTGAGAGVSGVFQPIKNIFDRILLSFSSKSTIKGRSQASDAIKLSQAGV